jgi:hypothetical protein
MVSRVSVRARRWKLLGRDGKAFSSSRPGTLGGHRRTRIFGRLDCPAALRAIARGGYVSNRVFFLNERTARAAGYRPCAACMPRQYATYKKTIADAAGYNRRA